MYCRLIPVILLVCLQTATRAEFAQGSCSCGVFEGSGKEPLYEHALSFDVSCDEDGAQKCMQLCLVLAQSAKERAGAVLCEKLNKHVENLKVGVHSKSCDADAWRFTGLQLSKPICCHEGKETDCNLTVLPN